MGWVLSDRIHQDRPVKLGDLGECIDMVLQRKPGLQFESGRLADWAVDDQQVLEDEAI